MCLCGTNGCIKFITGWFLSKVGIGKTQFFNKTFLSSLSFVGSGRYRKHAPPDLKTSKPLQSLLRTPKHKVTPKEPRADPAPAMNQPTVRPLPTLQIPSSLPTTLTPKQELLSWHLRLGHLPFGVLINAAKLGLLPTRLAKCTDHPKCPSCQYGMAHRHPWRTIIGW